MATVRPNVVSVVLVNFRGIDDTLVAIENLRQMDWSRDLLEIVVVDNASGDDSVRRLRDEAGDVVIVESSSNLGFAGGCNLGVGASSGEFVAFLNNDARPDTQWVSAAVSAFGESRDVGAVASKVMDWENQRVDYIGSALTWFGMGYKPFVGHPLPRLENSRQDVLFGTGSAMFVRRDVFFQLNGFDESYFMFFEDVDLGWRLNLLGKRFVYEPASVAFHRHHASMSEFGGHKETYLLERNALYTLFKNLGEPALLEILPAAIALATRRGVAKGELNSTEFDLRGTDDDEADVASVSKQSLATWYAVDQFVEHLPQLREARAEIQRTRVITDGQLERLFGQTDAPSYSSRTYLEGYENLVSAFDVTPIPTGAKVLVITGDPIGVRMAGPAIRAWKMAEALSASHTVKLLTLSGFRDVNPPFELVHIRPGDDRGFAPLEAWADVIVFQGHAMRSFQALRTTSKIIVADIYDPMHLEQLEQARGLPSVDWDRQVAEATDVMNEQLERADYLLCASDKQRDFYLGQLAALGRVNTANYVDDSALTRLIATVPFGLDVTPPVHTRAVLKGVHPGISQSDKLIVWSGGLYNWFDPKTLIKAVGVLIRRRPDVRLFFLGTQHPHPGVPRMAIVQESIDLAEEIGVLNKSVFFNDSWVDYEDRQNYLLEADLGVSTHFDHLETAFSFRTRILDYLWAELPMVVTSGDHFADLIESERLGLVVAAAEEEQLADALERALFDEDFRAEVKQNLARVRERYFWDRALRPLVEFVAEPRHANDWAIRGQATVANRPTRKKAYGLRHDIRRAAHYLIEGGPRVVVEKTRSRFRRSR